MLVYLATESDEGPNPVVPPVGEIVIGLIAFSLLAWVLMKYVFPRMEQTFQARRDAIQGGLERAEEAQAEAQRLLTDYKRQLAEARTEAAQIRDNARAEGQRIIDEMREQAQAESARIVQRGEEQLAAQRQAVVRDLRTEIGALAVQLSERIIGESLADDVRRQGTVDRFLDELDGMAAPATVGAPGAESGAGSTPPARRAGGTDGSGAAPGGGPDGGDGGKPPGRRRGPRGRS